MPPLRSVLWIGPGRGLAENGVTQAANLDLVWVRDFDEAKSLSLLDFEVAVLAHEEPHLQRSTLLQLTSHSDAPPHLLLSMPDDADALRALIAVGAGDVLTVPPAFARSGRDPELVHDRGDDPAWRRTLCDRIERLCAASDRRRGIPASPRGGALSVRHPGLIGGSDALRSTLELAERAARGSTTVLLAGETGSGKEVFARAIHRSSPRSSRPFVTINCAALNDNLLESELFGHMRGSFTGANTSKLGLFELARGGTLFLDEIGETSPSLQAKLLRALQDKEIRPVGGTVTRRIDVRIVAASNRDLRVEANHGRFREDLYYRLAVFPITIPPLRKRSDDILPLAHHFIELHGAESHPEPCKLSQAAAQLLLAHPWPGNVRELENAMHRAVTLADPGTLITPELLSDSIRSSTAIIEELPESNEPLKKIVARVESLVIRRALANNGGRRAMTARQLGLTREGLYKKMKRLGVE